MQVSDKDGKKRDNRWQHGHNRFGRWREYRRKAQKEYIKKETQRKKLQMKEDKTKLKQEHEGERKDVRERGKNKKKCKNDLERS